MKSFVFVAFCCLMVLSQSAADVSGDAAKEVFMKIMNECKTNTGASDAEVDLLIKHQPAGSMEGKCMRACIMKALGSMDANGKLSKEASMKIATVVSKGDEAKLKTAEEMIDACAAIAVPDDHCEASSAYGACFKKEAVARGIKEIHF